MYEINDSHYPIAPYTAYDSYYPVYPYTAYNSANILIATGMTTILFSFYLGLAKAELHYVVVGTFYGIALCLSGCALQLYLYMRSDKSQAVADIEE
jgi:hypothetical protein